MVPPRFLKAIDFEVALEVSFYTFSQDFAGDCRYSSLLELFLDCIKNAYKITVGHLSEENERWFLHCVAGPLVECLMNSVEHGNRFDSKKKFYVGCWLGTKGLAFCFRDEGDFFSRLEVKKKIWHRVRIKSCRPPGGGGTETIYLYTSKISLYKDNLCLLLLFDDIFGDFRNRAL